MSCKQEAECYLTSTKIILSSSGSFDVVEQLFRLRKNDIVHALCDPTEEKGPNDIIVYQASKIYTVLDADLASFQKAFKFEIGQVKAHYERPGEATERVAHTPDFKRKAENNQEFSSPSWASPPRTFGDSKDGPS